MEFEVAKFVQAEIDKINGKHKTEHSYRNHV